MGRTYRALLAPLLGGSHSLDPLLIRGALEDAMDVDTRQMDLVRVQLSGLEKLLHFGNTDLARTSCIFVFWYKNQ